MPKPKSTKTKIVPLKKAAPHPHDHIWADREYEKSFFLGILLMAFALFVNYFASYWASINISSPVGDTLLSYLPHYDLQTLIVVIGLILLAVMVWCGLSDPKKIPFIFKSAAMFILIRAVFINLTHLAPFSENLATDLNPIISFGLSNNGDLFFSGHTGMPFLAALGFWKDKRMRNFFFAGSIILGTLVLLGHYHYSIDVFGAFFITYGIHHINIRIFKKDWKLFREKPQK
jgi:hypothetical protein